MINLFSRYDSDAWDLHYSLEVSGVHNKTLSLEYDGFLPSDVSSPWEGYLYPEGTEVSPLHANRLDLPQGVELESKDGVFYLYAETGIIGRVNFYGDILKRIVKSVDYYDAKGNLLVTENYCDRGFVFRRDYYVGGSWVSSVYFNIDGLEVISHDLSTGIVRVGSRVFRGLSSFYGDYLGNLDESFLFTEEILSLGVLDSLGSNPMNTLVVTGQYGKKLPSRLTEACSRYRLIFTSRAQYEVSLPKYPSSSFAGIRFRKSSGIGSGREVVITTGTDKLVGIETLVHSCKNTVFHILASTLVSSRLEELGRLDNVKVYPAASRDEVMECFSKAGVFLDISYGATVFDANRLAVENSLLRLGVMGVSSGKYITRELLFDNSMVGVINILNLVAKNDDKLEELVKNQEFLLGYNSEESFSSVLE